jgi:hypothetical protein
MDDHQLNKYLEGFSEVLWQDANKALRGTEKPCKQGNIALSRSSGQETAQLLRDFDEHLFQTGHEPELLMEDNQLKQLDKVTKDWWS